MKDTTLCIKLNILEKCLHYLMITPRSNNFALLLNTDVHGAFGFYSFIHLILTNQFMCIIMPDRQLILFAVS